MSSRESYRKKYRFDDAFFEKIDTKFKAYFLGFIASDGHISINGIDIQIHKKDMDTLIHLRDNFCKDMQIKPKKNTNLVGFTVCSKKIRDDLCKYLGLDTYGKKAYKIKLPNFSSKELNDAFCLGFYDGDGSILNPYKSNSRYPKCMISSMNKSFLEQIKDRYSEYKWNFGDHCIHSDGFNCLDFLGRLYENYNFGMSRKKEIWELWCQWIPTSKGSIYKELEHFVFSKTRKDAIPPSKQRPSDSGYDIHILNLKKEEFGVEYYHTGIKVRPIEGWYFDLVPRSSIVKSGYMLANGIGVIDRGYTGEILVPLIKINKDAKLELPNKIVQLIPRPIIHCKMVECSDIAETSRSDGGFGSTNKI